MDRAQAHRVAQEAFPRGPEQIAECLGAVITYARINADGWCLRPPTGPPRITLNESAPKTRQRFTLAHEVSHLILGTQPEVVGRADRDLYHPTNPEEKAANQLASELLLPLPNIHPMLPRPPDSRSIRAAAESAMVSEVVMALRLVSKSAAFGLRSPVVAKLGDEVVEWNVPFDQPLPDDMACGLYSRALQCGGTTRVRSTEGEPVLVCELGKPTYPVLFFYWLPPEYETQDTPAESRFRLESDLFGPYPPNVRQAVNSYLGAFKPRSVGLTLRAATVAFWERYADRMSGLYPRELPTAAVDEYLRVRFREWGLKD